MAYRLIILVLLASMACQVNPKGCPPPQYVKLKKARPHHLKYLAFKAREAREDRKEHKQFFAEPEIVAKDLKNIEEWDCPKETLKHIKQMEKRARDLHKRHEAYVKRIAKESETRTATYADKTNDK